MHTCFNTHTQTHTQMVEALATVMPDVRHAWATMAAPTLQACGHGSEDASVPSPPPGLLRLLELTEVSLCVLYRLCGYG